jgi:hypothetical protein
MYVQRNIEARSFNHCCSAEAISITYSECVFVALDIQNALRKRGIILSPVASLVLPHFATLSHKRHDFRDFFFNKRIMIRFSLQICHFSFWEESNETWLYVYKSLHVMYPLFISQFNKTWPFSTDFRKIDNYETSWNSFQCEPSSSMRRDRWTGMTKPIVAFSNFAEAPKNQIWLAYNFVIIHFRCVPGNRLRLLRSVVISLCLPTEWRDNTFKQATAASFKIFVTF